jgi:hypothetical protein
MAGRPIAGRRMAAMRRGNRKALKMRAFQGGTLRGALTWRRNMFGGGRGGWRGGEAALAARALCARGAAVVGQRGVALSRRSSADVRSIFDVDQTYSSQLLEDRLRLPFRPTG